MPAAAVSALAVALLVLGGHGPLRRSTLAYPVLGGDHAAIAFGAGSTWVLESTQPLGGPAQPLGRPRRSDCGALVRIGPATLSATGTLGLRRCPLALAFGAGSVWVLGQRIGTAGYRLTRVDPARLSVRASTLVDRDVTPQGDTGAKSLVVAAGPRTVTVTVQTSSGASQVVTLAAATLTTVAAATIPPARGHASALTANHRAVWLGTTSGWLYRIDPRTGRRRGARRLGASVLGLSASDRAIWATIARPAGADLLRLDPTTGAVEHDTGLPILRAATDGPTVWGILATPRHRDTIARIDPRTGRIEALASSPAKPPAAAPDTIGAGHGAAWIVNTNLQTLTRVRAR